MFNKLINNIYPFLSLGVIEFGTLINNASNLLTILVFILQGVIGLLTIVKLWKDIKSKRFKSVDETENEVKKKHPFILALFTYLQKLKK